MSLGVVKKKTRRKDKIKEQNRIRMVKGVLFEEALKEASILNIEDVLNSITKVASTGGSLKKECLSYAEYLRKKRRGW